MSFTKIFVIFSIANKTAQVSAKSTNTNQMKNGKTEAVYLTYVDSGNNFHRFKVLNPEHIVWTWENGLWRAKLNEATSIPYPTVKNSYLGKAYWIKVNTDGTWQQ